jgi:hypothetical protein
MIDQSLSLRRPSNLREQPIEPVIAVQSADHFVKSKYSAPSTGLIRSQVCGHHQSVVVRGPHTWPSILVAETGRTLDTQFERLCAMRLGQHSDQIID